MSEEYFDVLDENGNKTGKTKLRKEVHRDGDWHRAVHIWIIDEKGEVLLQRRSANKDSHPNMLDISCAGHLSAGDTSMDGAKRELEEELNLKINDEDLEFIKTYKKPSSHRTSFINNEFCDLYVLRTNIPIEKMRYQEEEISEIFYVPYNRFKEMVVNHDSELLRHDVEFEILFKLFDEKYGK